MWGRLKHTVAWAEAYLRTKWHLDLPRRLATTDMGRKLGDCAPLGEGAGSPPNTMWPGLRPTSMPSFILIHPTVWPQYTNVTDRQDRQRSDSIRTNGRSKISVYTLKYAVGLMSVSCETATLYSVRVMIGLQCLCVIVIT